VRERHGTWAFAAALFAVLAGLAKVTTFVVFLPPATLLAWQWWRPLWTDRVRQSAHFWQATSCAVIPVLAGGLVAAWWVRHGDNLKDANPFAGFLASGPMTRWNWGSWDQRFSADFWTQNWQNISGMVLGGTPLAVLALGAAVVEPRYRRIAAAGVACFLGALLLFSNLYYVHDYYYCANAVFLLGAAGFLLVGIWDSDRLPLPAKWAAIILVLGGQLTVYYQDYGPYQRRELPAPPALAALARAVVPKGDFLIIYGWDWNSLLPYYAERRAVMVPRGRERETRILDDIVHSLPADRLSSLIIHQEDTGFATPVFVRERLNRFLLAPAPFASSVDGDLYLREDWIPAALAAIKGRTFPGVTINALPGRTPDEERMRDAALVNDDLSMLSPRPVRARGLFGLSIGTEAGRKVLLAHPFSEITIIPPAGATRIEAEAGLADASFAPGNASPSDGITFEIFELAAGNAHRTLFRRDLDPAREPADRGPQPIQINLPAPLAGNLVFRITPGPNNNLNSDWAYWARIDIR
jgi:hypothetical protein